MDLLVSGYGELKFEHHDISQTSTQGDAARLIKVDLVEKFH